METDDDIGRGKAALEDGRWGDARSAFQEALLHRESAEALEGLAQAHWWLCNAAESVRCRERAWVLLRQSGAVEHAGRAAIDLSISHLVNLGNDAAARGWLARAQRLTRTLRPNPLQGWLWLMEGYMARDPEQALDLMSRALDESQQTGDADLEILALSDLGLALLMAARVEEGLAHLDEAMAGTITGFCRRLDTVVFATCNMLAACHRIHDLERATRWCDAAEEFMRSYGSPFLYARCRVHYGGVLVAKGQWQLAEDQLRAALEMAEDAGAGPRTEALVQLADLRVRQGRLEEADALLTLVDGASGLVPAAAALRLARGESEIAAGLLERRSRLLGESHVEAAPTLALLVNAYLDSGDIDAAVDAVERLSVLADRQDHVVARAMAFWARGSVATARGSGDAIALLERALDELIAVDLPLETARVRLQLAQALADAQPRLAIVEADDALTAFTRLGASKDADEAAALLRALGVRRANRQDRSGELTTREREVLKLLGHGLSNPEIADRLFISRKTASHHVSRVLAKLGVRNRAEAAAYVARHRVR